MIAGAPIRDAAGKILAVLGLRIRPEVDFTRILAMARTGSTGETYACDAEGVLLSESRFDDQLKADRPDCPTAKTRRRSSTCKFATPAST